MDCEPQQLFTAEQAAAGVCVTSFIFLKGTFLFKTRMLVIFDDYVKHQIDEERKSMQNGGQFSS